MIRKGSAPEQMRDMTVDDIFIVRLNLLVIMSLAYLKGFPLGSVRAKSIIENCKIISKEIIDWTGGEFSNFRSEHEIRGDKYLNHIFYQRVRLLSVMASGFATGAPMGQFRCQALLENIEYISNTITFSNNFEMMESLLVA
ncbi:hypothetical protein [Desulforegula conservatrix]|uniref:hypothetical protein n=1 Tax=Desulforegula conservatrix TaxID=153026 RepID=UPI0003FA8ABC|nr:hypothetical protein [Desulforegula conservatrix]